MHRPLFTAGTPESDTPAFPLKYCELSIALSPLPCKTAIIETYILLCKRNLNMPQVYLGTRRLTYAYALYLMQAP